MLDRGIVRALAGPAGLAGAGCALGCWGLALGALPAAVVAWQTRGRS